MDVLMSLNHDGKLSDFLYKAYGSRSFCDVKIVTSDHSTYEAHRVVLAAFSDFFHKKLKRRKDGSTTRIQIDIRANLFKVLLEFMYTGQLVFSSNDRIQLYQATSALEIESAQELLQNAYISNDWPAPNSKSTNEKGEDSRYAIQEDANVLEEVKTEELHVDRTQKDESLKTSTRNEEKKAGSKKGDRKGEKKQKTQQKKNENYRPIRAKGMEKGRKTRPTDPDQELCLGTEGDPDKDPDFTATPKVSTRSGMVTRNKSKSSHDITPSVEVKEEPVVENVLEKNQTKKTPGRKPRSNSNTRIKRKYLKGPKTARSSLSSSIRRRKRFKVFVPKGKGKSCCSICKKSTKSSVTLTKHMALKHGSFAARYYTTRLLLRKIKYMCRGYASRLSRENQMVDPQGENVQEDGTERKNKPGAYKCKLCEKKFKFYSLFRRHGLREHGGLKHVKDHGGLYQNLTKYLRMRKQAFFGKTSQRKSGLPKERKMTNCNICGISISAGRNYAYHLRRMHDLTEQEAKEITGYPKFQKRRFKCQYCSRDLFRNLKQFKHHLRQEHNMLDFTYPCPRCENEYMSITSLKNHLRWVHAKDSEEILEFVDQLIQCEAEGCTFSCGNMSTLKHHVMTTHPGLKYTCSVCGFVCHVKSMLEHHMFNKHLQPEDKNRFSCEHCDKKFAKRAHLKMHMYRHHGVKLGALKVYKCTFEGCEKECTSSSSLKSHLRRHSKEKNFECPHCKQLLKTETTYRKHINKMHLGIRPHLCQICGQTFGEESELLSHIKNRHSNEKEFQCEHCPYATANKSTFFTHLYMVHKVRAQEDKRTVYQCPHCDFSTVLGHRYKTHVNGHKNIREYTCKVCNKQFISSSTLRAHKQWAHSDKKYSCSYCGYQTKTTQKLNEHIRIQHQLKGLKPYQCPYCSFTCATGGNTRKHIKQKHKGQEVRYIRDDSLLEAARLARKSGNTMTLNLMYNVPPPVSTEASSSGFEIPPNLPPSHLAEQQLAKPSQTIPIIQSYPGHSNIVEIQTATANLEQSQAVQSTSYIPIPSHSVYKIMNAPNIQMETAFKSQVLPPDVSATHINPTHLTALHPSLGPLQGGMHIVEASEIPVNENVIVSSVHPTLQPLVNVMHNHMQNMQ